MITMPNITHFLRLGESRLAPYLAGIADFVARQAGHPWKEPDALRLKTTETYLRNALAVGVLNHLQRPAFLATTERLIVLPACLKDYGDWECLAAGGDSPWECARCHPECTIYESIEQFGDDHTTVLIEPDDLGATLGAAKGKSGTIGVAGVACILTLLSGFDRTITLRLPTQGVFLNHTSCAHHWADPAYNTEYSLSRMAWVLGKEPARSPQTLSGRGETYSLTRSPLSPQDFYDRLDSLAVVFEHDYLPLFRAEFPSADLYDLSRAILTTFVPDLITRDNA